MTTASSHLRFVLHVVSRGIYESHREAPYRQILYNDLINGRTERRRLVILRPGADKASDIGSVTPLQALKLHEVCVRAVDKRRWRLP